MTDPTRESSDLPFVLIGASEPTSHPRDAVPAAPRRNLLLVVIIGTSGSLDYLRDATGDQRFWFVTVLRDDGPRDDAAPIQHLCSRDRRNNDQEME